MINAMTSSQLAEWMHYFELEPWDEERADLRAGIVASTLANIHRSHKTPAYTPLDFMLYTKRTERNISEAELEARLEHFMRTYH